MIENSKKNKYRLEIPIDVSGIEKFEGKKGIKVLLVNRLGAISSKIVKSEENGQAIAIFTFPDQPGALRLLIGPENAEDKELLGKQTLITDIPTHLWRNKYDLTLGQIVVPPYYWNWWLPSIIDFSPLSGYYGTVVTINGNNFSDKVSENEVKIGEQQALVISASKNKITAIVGKQAVTDKVTVTVGGNSTVSAMEFNILPYPDAESGDDGDPLIIEGQGEPSLGISPTGTLEILVSLVTPNDLTPANPTNLRNNVSNTWNHVKSFYEQASFGKLTVNVTLTSAWKTLSGDKNTYYDSSIYNIKKGVLDRLTAEAAQAASDDGKNLNDYDMMICCIFLNNTFIRAWGNFTNNSHFLCKDQNLGLNIDIPTTNPLYLVAINETADWGRCAHETGHNIIDSPAGAKMVDGTSLGEDVYGSDLIDPNVATAELFDIMGAHDAHPLFSGYYMEQMGYYDTNNTKHIRCLTWDRNPRDETFEIVAHGLSENVLADRCHLVKIKVSDGLFYYIEVRQTPGAATQIFDDSIPLNGAPNFGGVIVTKVYTDIVNTNQQIRFITLLHDPVVLKVGESAIDPARNLTISIENDSVVTRPLVCRVRVQWAQNIGDVPDGSFDLKIEPWDSNWQTPDIWVDRKPYGTYDNTLDADGRPIGNGDKPKPKEINRFYTRIHNEGADRADNVMVTFYSVEPPGVGDNGNWAPLDTVTIASIDANNYKDVNVNWTPLVDRHTCLKVCIQQQLGEVKGNNNQAQENVFDFEAPASSRPDAVVMPVAVRNPLNNRTLVYMEVGGIPKGYVVQFPHRWLWLNPKQERTFDFTIIPVQDYWWYREMSGKKLTTRIGLMGRIPKSYKDEVPPGVLPASRMLPIGGVSVNVTPKQRVQITIEASQDKYVYVRGNMTPKLQNEIVRVDVVDPFGYLRCVNAITRIDGSFNIRIDVSKPPESTDLLPPGHPNSFPISGIYSVQARTINSPNAAQAESNIVPVKITF